MGITHAISAVAVVMLLAAFLPSVWSRIDGGSGGLAFLALFCLVTAGGALMPDLDNTASSAQSALGFVGEAISIVFRATSPLIQSLVRTGKDNDDAGGHRGFYHTAVAALLFGLLFVWLCGPFGPLPGRYVALGLAFVSAHIALSVLAKPVMYAVRRAGGLLGFLMPTLLSIGVVYFLWVLCSSSMDYAVMGVGFGLGWFIHEVGDCFTKQGCPILWPVPIKGKMWWDVRFAKLQTGWVGADGRPNPAEYIFCAVFLLIAVLSAFAIVGNGGL